MSTSTSATSTSTTSLPPLWCVHRAGVQLEQIRAATALAARRVVARKRGLPFAELGAVQVGPAVTLLPRPQPTSPTTPTG